MIFVSGLLNPSDKNYRKYFMCLSVLIEDIHCSIEQILCLIQILQPSLNVCIVVRYILNVPRCKYVINSSRLKACSLFNRLT